MDPLNLTSHPDHRSVHAKSWQTRLRIGKREIIAVIVGLLSIGLLYPVYILREPIAVSINIGFEIPLLITMAWGWRAGLLSGVIVSFYGTFSIFPGNGWAGISSALVTCFWYTMHGWAAEYRARSRRSWLWHPWTIEVIYRFFYAAFIFTVFRWSFWLNPPFWYPQADLDMPVDVLRLIALKSAMGGFLMVMTTHTVLRIGPLRRVLGLQPQDDSYRYDTLITLLGIAFSALFYFFDVLSYGLMTHGQHWWTEFFEPAPQRVLTRVLLVVVCLGMTNIIADLVSRRLSLVRALESSREQFRALFRSIGDGVIATDVSGAITQMNPVAENMTGWTMKEAVGRPLTEIILIVSHPDREKIADSVEQVLTTGGYTTSPSAKTLISRDGSEFLVADSAAPILLANGELNGAVLVFRDVTQEHARQEQLRQSQKMNAVGQLAAGIAHDFNNILGGIVGALEILDVKTGDNPDHKRIINLALETAYRAAGLTKNLLNFSRKNPVKIETIELYGILSDTLTLLEGTLVSPIIFEVKLESEHCLVKGDASQLQNAFLNLFLNAIQSMPNGGRLILSSTIADLDEAACQDNLFDLQPQPHVEVQISDTGCGIPPENVGKIFEPFFTTKVIHKGTGLGLAVVFGAIKAHRGAISVTSEPGRGTSFKVLLPKQSDNIEERIQKTQDTTTRRTAKILLIDDDAMVRSVAAEILRNLGHTVTTAVDGSEGLSLYRASPSSFDLVVLDVIMPVMGGRECLIAMKAIRADVRVILCSGFVPESQLNDMRAQGLHGFVQKPFSAEKLSQAVHQALTGKSWPQ